MTAGAQDDATRLVDAACSVYADDAEALAVLDDLGRRLREPLRIAVAGIVKAGKSTLLNALLGEQIAPTDAAECTRVVTWYRYADTPAITVFPRDGEPRSLPVRRDHGRLVVNLGQDHAEDIQRIEVAWPCRALREATLIDTPGIASLSAGVSERSARFLIPEDAPSSADAIVYLMRHVHASDVTFLEAFRDTAAGYSKTVNALAVLSRADEIGSGRIDSMLSARRVAARYENDGELAALALGVVPVAGLLAEGARTLREREYADLRALADLERSQRERLLVSADRFVGTKNAAGLSGRRRRELLDRFGIFGVRVAATLIRGGARDSSELAAQLVQQSGLDELSALIRRQFRARAALLKVRGALEVLGRVVRERPHEGTSELAMGIERIQSTAHGLRELDLLSRLRTTALPIPSGEAEAAAQIVGGDGIDPSARLGMSDQAAPADLRAEAARQLDHWRALSQSPLMERAGVEVCRVVIRSLEHIASEVVRPRAADAADVLPTAGPGDGAGQRADEEGKQDEPALDGQSRTQERAMFADRDELHRDEVEQ